MWLTFNEFCKHRSVLLGEMAQSKDEGKFRVELDDQDRDFIRQAVDQGITPVTALRTRYTIMLSDEAVGESGPVKFFGSGKSGLKTVSIERTHKAHLQRKLKSLGMAHAAEHGLSPREEMDAASSSNFYNAAFGRQNAADILKNGKPIDVNYGRSTGSRVKVAREVPATGDVPVDPEQSDVGVATKKRSKRSAVTDMEPTASPSSSSSSSQEMVDVTTKPVPNDWSTHHFNNLLQNQKGNSQLASLLDLNTHPEHKGMYDFPDVWKEVETLVGDVSQPGKHILPEVWKLFKDKLPRIGQSIYIGVRTKLKEHNLAEDILVLKQAMMQTTAMLLSDPLRGGKRGSGGDFLTAVNQLFDNSKEIANMSRSLVRQGFLRKSMGIGTDTGLKGLGDATKEKDQFDSHGSEQKQSLGSEGDIAKELEEMEPYIERIRAKLARYGWEVRKLSTDEQEEWERYEQLHAEYQRLTSSEINKARARGGDAGVRRGNIHPEQDRLNQVQKELEELKPQVEPIIAKLDASNWDSSRLPDEEWEKYKEYDKLEKELKRLQGMNLVDVDDLPGTRFQRRPATAAHEQVILGFNAWCNNREKRDDIVNLQEGSNGWNDVRNPQTRQPYQVIIGPVKLKIVYNPDNREYCVRWIEGRRTNDDKSNYTDSLEDAINTMRAMAASLHGIDPTTGS